MSFQPKQAATVLLNQVGNRLLSPPHGGAGFYRNHGPRDQRRVALTFDDGPNDPSTGALLDAMGELNVSATFFCVGVNAQLNPDLVARADAEGHVIGNHSLAHSRTAGLKFGRDDGHIDGGAQVISQILGRRPLLYRPPWGWLTPWEGYRLVRRGYAIIGWDIYTQDWRHPEVDGLLIAEDTFRTTCPGSIFLFHDGVPGVQVWEKRETIRAVRRLVPMLRAEGYEFVTIPELLGVPAYAPLGETTMHARGVPQG